MLEYLTFHRSTGSPRLFIKQSHGNRSKDRRPGVKWPGSVPLLPVSQISHITASWVGCPKGSLCLGHSTSPHLLGRSPVFEFPTASSQLPPFPFPSAVRPQPASPLSPPKGEPPSPLDTFPPYPTSTHVSSAHLNGRLWKSG